MLNTKRKIVSAQHKTDMCRQPPTCADKSDGVVVVAEDFDIAAGVRASFLNIHKLFAA